MGWFKKEKVKAESAQISIDSAVARTYQVGTWGLLPTSTWPTLGMATTTTAAKGITPEMIIKELNNITVYISPHGDVLLKYDDECYDIDLNPVIIVPSRVESVYKQCTVLEFLRKLNDKAKK